MEKIPTLTPIREISVEEFRQRIANILFRSRVICELKDNAGNPLVDNAQFYADSMKEFFSWYMSNYFKSRQEYKEHCMWYKMAKENFPAIGNAEALWSNFSINLGVLIHNLLEAGEEALEKCEKFEKELDVVTTRYNNLLSVCKESL